MGEINGAHGLFHKSIQMMALAVERPIRLIQFENLRKRVNDQIFLGKKRRIRTNPHATDEEARLGAFVEQLEPQVSYAVQEFNRKGYQTECSGFFGRHGEKQVIFGSFVLGEESVRKLSEIGVEYIEKGRNWNWVQFDPVKADLNLMEEKWRQIADLLPDTGKPADPSQSNGSVIFRRKFVKNDLVISS